MTLHLNLIDLVVVIAYLLLIFVAGVWFFWASAISALLADRIGPVVQFQFHNRLAFAAVAILN